MIVGLGTDVFEVIRMERALRDGDPGFEDAVFTAREIAACRSQPDPPLHFAIRFAIKEAVWKAFATGAPPGLAWRDIEVRTGGVQPEVVLHGPFKRLAEGRAVTRILTSVGRARGRIAASAVLEA